MEILERFEKCNSGLWAWLTDICKIAKGSTNLFSCNFFSESLTKNISYFLVPETTVSALKIALKTFVRVWCYKTLWSCSYVRNFYHFPRIPRLATKLETESVVVFRRLVFIKRSYIFHDGSPYNTETSSLICRANVHDLRHVRVKNNAKKSSEYLIFYWVNHILISKITKGPIPTCLFQPCEALKSSDGVDKLTVSELGTPTTLVVITILLQVILRKQKLFEVFLNLVYFTKETLSYFVIFLVLQNWRRALTKANVGSCKTFSTDIFDCWLH